jgi:hypothetical protein
LMCLVLTCCIPRNWIKTMSVFSMFEIWLRYWVTILILLYRKKNTIMVQWQRHIFPILRRIHKGVENANSSATNLVIYRFGSSLSQG